MASSRYRSAVAWEIPNPRPSRAISGRSRNQARAKTACRQVFSARVPLRVPISRRVRSQQFRYEQGQLDRDVEHDTIRQHRGAFPVARRSSARPLLPGAISRYVRVSAWPSPSRPE
jgi:hypothetical protein